MGRIAPNLSRVLEIHPPTILLHSDRVRAQVFNWLLGCFDSPQNPMDLARSLRGITDTVWHVEQLMRFWAYREVLTKGQPTYDIDLHCFGVGGLTFKRALNYGNPLCYHWYIDLDK